MSAPARVIGVVGAGTMGAGIAQLAAVSGARTLLHDPVPGAVERAMEAVRAGLERAVERGRMTAAQAQEASARLEPVPAHGDLAPCELIIEAAPEDLALKHELFAALSAAAPGAVLASNTSSIPISAIAPAAADPGRVVGLHFFNPAPAMRLVEVIGGLDSGPAALALARATGEAMGKVVIDAADVTGFLVNRCSRPVGLEALRLLGEGVADVPTIDRIVRLGGGLRMGPFELQDLVGIDTGFAVARSFWDLSFGEPRWRPSPLSARLVAAGHHGRKTGRGWYRYADGVPHRPDDPPAPPVGGGHGPLVITGQSPLAVALRGRAAAAGWTVTTQADDPHLRVECAPQAGDDRHAPHRLVLLEHGSLARVAPDRDAAGFMLLAPLGKGGLLECTRGPATTDETAARAEHLATTLGMHHAWVGDAPGLVLGRIVAQLVNECAFALGEGVGSAADIDAGLQLGLNHPRGALAWARAIGPRHVLAMLDALWEEYREERYRAAPLLRRGAAALTATG